MEKEVEPVAEANAPTATADKPAAEAPESLEGIALKASSDDPIKAVMDLTC
jgi:hypothetical protein